MKILIYLSAVISINLVEGAGKFNPTVHRNWKQLNSVECGYNPAYSSRLLLDTGLPKPGRKVKVGEFPWVVLIFIRAPGARANDNCMGTIISHRFIVTASNCFRNYGSNPISTNSIYLRAGELDTTTDPDCEKWGCAPKFTTYNVDKVIFYLHNGPASYGNNIALIKTTRKIIFTDFVAPICMQHGEMLEHTFGGRRGVKVSGWGTNTVDYKKSTSLVALNELNIAVPWVLPALHDLVHGSAQDDNQLVSDDSYFFLTQNTSKSWERIIHDTDMGGPLAISYKITGGEYHRQYLHGIISFSTSVLVGNSPQVVTVCTAVRYYLEWILEQMDPDIPIYPDHS